MKTQEKLFFVVNVVEFVTKIFTACGVVIFCELWNCDNKRGLKTKMDFCHDNIEPLTA